MRNKLYRFFRLRSKFPFLCKINSIKTKQSVWQKRDYCSSLRELLTRCSAGESN